MVPLRHFPIATSLALAVVFIVPAHAHITLERQEANIGGSYKAVFRVPHGCGTSPTLRVRVRIPEGVIGVKPMPKPGWQIDTVTGKYDKIYTMFHDVKVTEGVKEVAWSGRLPDENYDEMVMQVYLTDDLQPGRTLYFPVVQECESGVQRWIDSSSDSKEPAPGVKLLPKR
jgi:uncharacterized protein YcnI